ncbi:sensor histidine kinase [Streptomyces jumonjinensis]|uniref:histidine kinase n=1 Tax=Streptomyces jumonjinensis TaxID=1945 RepID=A0A646KRM8_STRJU|nr:HAMP domain-containing sensor histidine kinase [Streptomyces jumonjinensis]MQT04885.1 HAMP domain-containing histidine kinase [Streptomyces jumonjinensis]
MTGRTGRFRTLPLRSRLALLVATAVAVAVAAVAVVSWLLTRAQLYEELNNTLRNTTAPAGMVQEAYDNCSQQRTDRKNSPSFAYIQLIDVNGNRCVSPYSEPVRVQPTDIAVARGAKGTTLHNSVTDDGDPVRVHTTQELLGDGTRIAISVSRPLDEISTSLNRLALLLTGLAGVGVIGAGAAGLLVAQTGLRPVDRLTEAVEHVARTEDLTVRIPADGEDEIARLSRSFNSMTAALASSRDRQARLIADAGHELRTPLTSLRTNIELLARSEQTGRAIPAADRQALMASVKAQMAELASLIGDLQELSRPDAVHGGPLTVIALHEITEAALARARLRGPELEFSTDLGPWYVRGEAAALERALVNVLDNAVKFSPPDGTVEVRLKGGELTVRDHGPGITADELPHVFERFWRSSSARSLPGSGLGLSIVARTVQQAGGEIRLEPAAGGGTLAVIRLPGASHPPPSQL